jgi:hypothetical protein
VADVPLIIDQPRPGPTQRARSWLRARRIFLAASLALAEVIAFLIWRPGLLLATLFAALLLAVCVMGAARLRPGLARDVLVIVAIAQALVVVLPIAVGLSLFAGILIALVLIVALVVIAFRYRF